MLVADEVPEDRVVALVVVLTRPSDVQESTSSHPVQLAVRDPIRMDELSELDQQFLGEGLVATEALRLADESQQALRVAPSECRHGSQRYDECRMDSSPGPREPVSHQYLAKE